jgi:hypothetical protein
MPGCFSPLIIMGLPVNGSPFFYFVLVPSPAQIPYINPVFKIFLESRGNP